MIIKEDAMFTTCVAVALLVSNTTLCSHYKVSFFLFFFLIFLSTFPKKGMLMQKKKYLLKNSC